MKKLLLAIISFAGPIASISALLGGFLCMAADISQPTASLKEFSFTYGRTGRISTILTEETMTIREFKEEIAQQNNVPAENINISDETGKLTNDQTLDQTKGLLHVTFTKPYTQKPPKWHPSRREVLPPH